jgi:hypothetical protein
MRKNNFGIVCKRKDGVSCAKLWLEMLFMDFLKRDSNSKK